MKLDLLNKEIQDEYVRENFERIKRDLEAQQILSGFWNFFEVEFTQLGVKVPFKHNLKFIPKDIIILSVEGSRNFYFNYEDFDATNLYITVTAPCRVRFLAGNYRDRVYGGSKKDFTFVPPPSDGIPTWFSGAGNPGDGLGLAGDFYLNTDSKGIFLKVNGEWIFQGTLNSPTSFGSALFEEVAVAVTANVWTLVPLSQINKVSDATIFDNLNAEEVEIAWRIVGGGSQVEINSKKSTTYTVRVEGFEI